MNNQFLPSAIGSLNNKSTLTTHNTLLKPTLKKAFDFSLWDKSKDQE